MKVSEKNSQKRRNFTLKLHLDAKDSPDGKPKVVFSRSVRTAHGDNELDAYFGAYVEALNNTGSMPPDVEGTRTVQFLFRDLNNTVVVPILVAEVDAKLSYDGIREGILQHLRDNFIESRAARIWQNKNIQQWMKELGTDIYSVSESDFRTLCARANFLFKHEYSEQQKARYVRTSREALLRMQRDASKKNTDKSRLVRPQTDK